MSQFSLLPVVSVVNGQPVASSLDVSAYFGMPHAHVLRSIRELNPDSANSIWRSKSGQPNPVSRSKSGSMESQSAPSNRSKSGPIESQAVPSNRSKSGSIESQSDPSYAFARENFVLSSYLDTKGRRYPLYLMTKNGFTLLAFGFRTPRAREFQIAYITAFDAMAERLARQNDAETLARGRMQAAARLAGSRAALADAALALLDEGLTQRQVAEMLHVSRHTVYRLKKRFGFLTDDARGVAA